MINHLSRNDHTFDSENPWPGLDAFNESGKEFFHGRDEEANTLLRLVRNARLVVLLGRSGRGKSSLLQAGLFPKLRTEHYLPILIRLSFQNQTASLIDQVKNVFIDQLEEQGIEYKPFKNGETLWEYLHGKDMELWSLHNHLLTPVFVFDQFEELFISNVHKTPEGVRFRQDMADLIENLIPETPDQWGRNSESRMAGLDIQSHRYKVILSFREDFLPKIESWRHAIPSLMLNHLRLRRMNGAQAFAAVYKTGGKKLVSEDVSREIVRFAAGQQEAEHETLNSAQSERIATPAGAKDQTAEIASLENLRIEPTLLSLICFKLNKKRKESHGTVIDLKLLASTGRDIKRQFYEDCIRDIPDSTRRFIEDELISKSGFRNSYPKKDAVDRQVITDDLLERLVHSRLLRVENHNGHDCIELVHDVLTDVIRESRDHRVQLEKEKQQKRNEEALRQKTRQWVAFALFMSIVSVTCGVLAIGFHDQRIKAQNAEKHAFEMQAKAEKLANTMLYNLKDKLKPLGKLDLLAAVVEESKSYYENIDPSQITDKSLNKHAIALNALGEIEQARGNLGAAQTHYQQGSVIFEKLTATDPKNIQWKKELADSYGRLGDIEIERGNRDNARDYYQRRFDIFQNPANKERDNPEWQRELGISYLKMSRVEQLRQNQDELMNNIQESLRIFERLAKINPKNTQWQQDLAEAYTERGHIYARDSKTFQKAFDDYTTALEITQNLVEKDRENAQWQSDLATSYYNLGDIEKKQRMWDKAGEHFKKCFRIDKRLAAKDPTNADWQRNLTNSYRRHGEMEQKRNHLETARNFYQQSYEISEHWAKKAPDNILWQVELAISTYRLGKIEQKSGEWGKALIDFKKSFKIFKNLVEKDPGNQRRQDGLAKICDSISEVCVKMNDPAQARIYSDQANEIRTRLASAKAGH